MHHPLRPLIIATLLTLLPASALGLAPEPFEPTEVQRKKLESGGVVVEVERDDGFRTDVVALVDAPADKVWGAIDDYDVQKEWVPDMMEMSKVVRTEGKYKICRSGTDLPWPLANRVYDLKVWNRQEAVGGVDSYVSSYSYVEGSGNINAMDGYWLVQSWGDDGQKTLVRQYTIVDLGISMPKAFIKSGTNKRLPNIMKALRRRVE
jgi:hypothetical protein